MAEIPKMTQTEALARLAGRVAQWGSQDAAAKAFGVAPSFLNMVLHRKRAMGPTLAKVMGLRAKRYVIYRYEELR